MGYFGEQGTKVTWANPKVTPESQRQNGGWYYNPATGTVDRWWSEGGPANQESQQSTPFSQSQSTTPPAKSAQQIVDDIIKSQEEQINRETKFLEGYTKDNPFVFDEELARKSSEAEYSPYYTEILDDYLKDIGVNRDSLQSDQKLLATLSNTSAGTAGQAQRAYTRAVAKAQQGFAESGTFYSGTAKRALGEANVERNAVLDQTATGIMRKERDVSRQETEAVEGGVLQRQEEAMKQYYTPLTQSYYRQFPSDSAGVLAGYVPSSYLRL